MSILLDPGISLILFLQGLGDWLTLPMKFFSYLGQEEFFLLIMPGLFWCIDAGLGLRVGIMLMISTSLNGVLKLVMQGPRPYFYSPEIKALGIETSFGIPSGHAQNAAGVWGLLAALASRRWMWALAITLIFLIGLSRLYLGVHFPTDVLLGWAVGIALVWAFVRLEPWVAARIRSQQFPEQVLSVFGVSLFMLLIAALAKLSLGAWTLPQGWIDNILLTLPEAELPNPLELSGQVSVAGAFFGLAAGAFYLKSRGWFDASGDWSQRLMRFPVGLIGVLVLWYGLGAIFPRGEYLLSYGLRYLRYALVGAWISGIAPLIFIRLGWARSESRPSAEPSLPTQAAHRS